MTESNVIAAIRSKYSAFHWLVLTHVRTETGYTLKNSSASQFYTANGVDDSTTERYIDALALNLAPSSKFQRIAFEIKVSRSDFLSELRDPDKSSKARAIADRFYFAMPRGIYRKDDDDALHELGAGVMEVTASAWQGRAFYHMELVKRGRALVHSWPLPESFVASLLRNAFVEGGDLREQKS